MMCDMYAFFFFSSRRRHTRFDCDWSSDVCSSDLGDHEELLTMHAGNQDRAKSKREHGEENSARKAESIGERIFLTQHRQSGGDRAVDEKAGDAGEQRVPAKIACDGKYQKQHGKNHDRDMRGSKTGMEAAEESREIAALAHGKSDTRGVQDVGAEISVR